jgi:DNA-binding GntR family transcriptional regulator
LKDWTQTAEEEAILPERPPLKAEQIYWLIRDDIVRLRMQPGEPIAEKALCAQYGVSRTPVREALKRLVDEDLVNVYPHSGTYVSRISFSVAQDGYVIRRALEVEGVRRAAGFATVADIARLTAIIAGMREILRRNTLADYLQADDAFHSAIADMSRCPRMWRFINLAKVHLDRLRQLSAPVPGHLAMVTDQHEAIVGALRDNSIDRAELAMKIHLDSSFAVMSGLHSDDVVDDRSA